MVSISKYIITTLIHTAGFIPLRMSNIGTMLSDTVFMNKVLGKLSHINIILTMYMSCKYPSNTIVAITYYIHTCT